MSDDAKEPSPEAMRIARETSDSVHHGQPKSRQTRVDYEKAFAAAIDAAVRAERKKAVMDGYLAALGDMAEGVCEFDLGLVETMRDAATGGYSETIDKLLAPDHPAGETAEDRKCEHCRTPMGVNKHGCLVLGPGRPCEPKGGE